MRGYESYSPRALNGQLHGLHEFGMTERLTYNWQRPREWTALQKKIVSDVLQGPATDLSGAFADKSPTTRIREYGTKENTTQLKFSNCSVVFNNSK